MLSEARRRRWTGFLGRAAGSDAVAEAAGFGGAAGFSS
jgi:hypothetical protein